MFNVITPEQAGCIIKEQFVGRIHEFESVKLPDALGHVLHSDITANEDIPGFDRSTVDGYAVKASDTFGSSESIPAVLNLTGEILMGECAETALLPGTCMIVSTGGAIPPGADAVVMHEHTEDYGNDMIGMQKPTAPGNNVIFRGDDVTIGDVVLSAGTCLKPHDIGILSALGISEVCVKRKPIIGIISTGDELVATTETPNIGQIRDVNTPMLMAAASKSGAESINYGIFKDKETEIKNAVKKATDECDIILISGGSSAGLRDLTAKIIASEGEILFHGIAMKPGKPTILGKVKNKPVFGLPGHPVAAYLVTELFVCPLISQLLGTTYKIKSTQAKLTEAISSNHGRAEYIPVVFDEDGNAHPVKSKSGLISSLKNVTGYICIPRDCEGLEKDIYLNVVHF